MRAIYDQIHYLDARGQEIIRINYNRGEPKNVGQEQLQNKAGRYYFDDTYNLNAGQIFVSPFDLNIERREDVRKTPRYSFGDLEKHAVGLHVDRSMLLRNDIQEYLLRMNQE
ncbi:MAG: hypothetical protein KZQ80_06415 [Candidatus Thiodiazotropha sp. (ex Monitilora ramsayi)]|nr:hypothetical protein [Candidatus Thiodiazotropha sp. (ex Monitilora ramsayi)]